MNYYRGKSSKCPVSLGGGDRPTRDATSRRGNSNHLSRLSGPEKETSVLDWVGDIQSQDVQPVLSEGVTHCLQRTERGSFLADTEEGETVSALVSNLFVAPIFRHKAATTDYLMILNSTTGQQRSDQKVLRVILREFPASLYCVGQTEPRYRVPAPPSPAARKFTGQFTPYLISRYIQQSQPRGGGVTFPELCRSILPLEKLASTFLRSSLR